MDFLFTVRLGNPKKGYAELFSWTVAYFLLIMRAHPGVAPPVLPAHLKIRCEVV